MKKPKFLIYKTVIAFLCLAIGLPLMAADTGQINYQARLLDSFGRRLNTTVNLSFKIYDAVSAGNLLWSETQAGVIVQDGVYSVVLGSQTPIPTSVFAQNNIYLELGINAETMTPRQQITASAYALVARTIMGSNVFEDQTSGYVGVGTTNPAVKLDVSGTVQAAGFKMPTGASSGYVLTSDANGVGQWHASSVVTTETDPIHTNWVRVTFTPATNELWNAVNDRVLAATYNSATGALWGAVAERVLRAGDTMTGPLTNLAGFFGDGAGLTNISSSGVSLTGVVHRVGDSMTGPLMVSNNVIVTLTNQAGWLIATNSISLGGMVISNWTQVGGGNLTNDLVSLQGATNTLNAAVTNLNAATNNLLLQITNNLANQVLTNTAVDLRVAATETGMVKKIGDTMTGVLNIETNLVVSNRVGIGTAGPINKLDIRRGGIALIDEGYNYDLGIGVLAVNTSGNSRMGSFYGTGNAIQLLSHGATMTGGVNIAAYYGPINFANDLAGSPVTRMTISTNSNVGIGTNTPSARLHVARPTGATGIKINGLEDYSYWYLDVDAANSANLLKIGTILYVGNGGIGILTGNGATGAYIDGKNVSTRILGAGSDYIPLGIWGGTGTRTAPYFAIASRSYGTATSDVFVVHASGNVGIAVTNPAERLHVNGSVAIETNLVVSNRVGIGTVSPAVTLDVYGPSSEQVRIRDIANANIYGRIGFVNDTYGAFGIYNSFTDAGAVIAFGFGTSAFSSTAGSQKITILGSGNFGIGTNAPNSKLQVAGAIATAVTSKTGDYTLTATNSVVLCDATSATFIITLPTAAGITGRQYTIKKIDSSGNAVTVDGNASETIDGAANYSLAAQWKYVTIASDGANWVIIANN